jgi:ABC-type transport system substrate-binding protein
MTRWAAWLLAALLAGAVAPVAAQVDAPQKVLRYAFRTAETGFDPAQINDLYSRIVTAHLFEGLYGYDPLARPSRVYPLTAAALPEHSADFRTWTVKLRPGIHFADDPVFKGARRELTAADYVYSFKRFADPKVKSPAWTWIEQFDFVGLAELRKDVLEHKRPFDYDRPIEGLRELDRYTLQFRLRRADPRFLTSGLATGDLTGAVAREVVEFYGDDITAHPVGTGPFVLKQWRRSSFIALERNPTYRERYYDAEPAADDLGGQALLARLKGRRLPMLDRVEISIIDEEQPRWLSFLQGGADLIEMLPFQFVSEAMPHGKLAPAMAKRGMQGYQRVRADVQLTFFNFDNPLLGGYTPDKVALRRALCLAVDVDSEIRLARRGQAIPAQSPVVPHTWGYDPAFKSENGEYSPARAKALLDMYGYVDRDGDGWRDMPDGSALQLQMATQPDQDSRQLDEQWKRDMTAIGVRIAFVPAKWPENLKNARNGKLMMWRVGLSAADPDGLGSLRRYHSTQIGGWNMARFKLPAFDAVYDRIDTMPDNPERKALFAEANKLAAAYAPYKNHVHRIYTDMAQPWLIGYRSPLFWLDFWQYMDVDLDEKARRTR